MSDEPSKLEEGKQPKRKESRGVRWVNGAPSRGGMAGKSGWRTADSRKRKDEAGETHHQGVGVAVRVGVGVSVAR